MDYRIGDRMRVRQDSDSPKRAPDGSLTRLLAGDVIVIHNFIGDSNVQYDLNHGIEGCRPRLETIHEFEIEPAPHPAEEFASLDWTKIDRNRGWALREELGRWILVLYAYRGRLEEWVLPEVLQEVVTSLTYGQED